MALLLGQRGRVTAHSWHCPPTCYRAWPGPGGGGSRMLQIDAPGSSPSSSPCCQGLQYRVESWCLRHKSPTGWSRFGFGWELHGGAAVWVQEPLVRASAPTPQAEAALLHPSRVCEHLQGGDGSEPVGPQPSHSLLGGLTIDHREALDQGWAFQA